MSDLFEGAYPDPPKVHLTDGEKRRARQQALIDLGMHPLSDSSTNQLPLLVTTQPGSRATCGDCTHRVRLYGGSKTWPKCELGPATHGPATDVWASWPACTRYEPRGSVTQ